MTPVIRHGPYGVTFRYFYEGGAPVMEEELPELRQKLRDRLGESLNDSFSQDQKMYVAVCRELDAAAQAPRRAGA